jgi:hypothetical protein
VADPEPPSNGPHAPDTCVLTQGGRVGSLALHGARLDHDLASGVRRPRGLDGSKICPVPVRLPQARDFDKLRLLLQLVAAGHRDPKEIGELMGAGPWTARATAVRSNRPRTWLARDRPRQ